MLLWLGFKAPQRQIHLESGLARGGQKSSISFDLLQNMMLRGIGPKASDPYPTQLLVKTFFWLLIHSAAYAGDVAWLAGWLAGWLGWVGWLGWLG